MNNQKIKPVVITLDDKNYNMRFDFNCFCELDEIYGDLNILLERLGKPKMKDLRNIIYAAIKYEDDSLTPLRVGQMINGLADIAKINKDVFEALKDAMPIDNSKNVMPQSMEEEKSITGTGIG